MRRSTHFPQVVAAAGAGSDVFEPLGNARVVEHGGHSVRLKSGNATIEVAALAPDLFRAGLFGDGRPVDYRSEAVAKREWQPDGVRFEAAADEVRISSGSAAAQINLAPLRISFSYGSGRRPIAVDDPLRGPYSADDEFLVGAALLVAPVARP